MAEWYGNPEDKRYLLVGIVKGSIEEVLGFGVGDRRGEVRGLESDMRRSSWMDS